jgi:hypothetical protein
VTGVTVLRGKIPDHLKGSGSGSGDGYGYGYGYGDGYGYGYGSGDGYGYGSGDGYGYGYGYGDGYGYGYGDGYGSGSGDGYGDGYGSGYGDGYGYGSGSGVQEYQRVLFIRNHNLLVRDGAVILFKSVRTDNRKDAHTNTIKYEGVVECPDWDPDESRECGGGLHLSAIASDALSFYPGGVILKCRVKLEDFLIYKDNYKKVRCRRVEVL